MDHELGRSRGTGFVCFWNKEDADKAIEQSEILRQETTGGESVQVPFGRSSMIDGTHIKFIAQKEPVQASIPSHSGSICICCQKLGPSRTNLGCYSCRH